MLQRRLLALRQPASHFTRPTLRRWYATRPSPPPSPPTSRIARIEARLPRFLRRIVTPLRNAPLSHVTAFLILHEITAVVPVLGLAAFFHYSNWLPPYISEGKWVSEGTQKFGSYLRRKGWISDADDKKARSGRWWGRGESGVKLVAEFATAYAITKALLPLRLMVSVWGTPWFATWTVLPVTGALKRMFRRGAGAKAASPAAGTNAVLPSPAAITGKGPSG